MYMTLSVGIEDGRGSYNDSRSGIFDRKDRVFRMLRLGSGRADRREDLRACTTG